MNSKYTGSRLDFTKSRTFMAANVTGVVATIVALLISFIPELRPYGDSLIMIIGGLGMIVTLRFAAEPVVEAWRRDGSNSGTPESGENSQPEAFHTGLAAQR